MTVNVKLSDVPVGVVPPPRRRSDQEDLDIEPEPVDPAGGYKASNEALERMKARVAQL